MKKHYCLNLLAAILCFICAILQYTERDYFVAVVYIILTLINTFLYLDSWAKYWKGSVELQTKFTFTCPSCKTKITPTFWTWFLVPPVGSLRYLKCKECQNWHWMKRK